MFNKINICVRTKRYHLVFECTMERLDKFRILIYDYNFVCIKSF